jgi:hypothetical protein
MEPAIRREGCPERGPGGLLVVTILIGRTEKGPSFSYTLHSVSPRDDRGTVPGHQNQIVCPWERLNVAHVSGSLLLHLRDECIRRSCSSKPIDQASRRCGFDRIDHCPDARVVLIETTDDFEGIEMKRMNIVRSLQSVCVDGHIQDVVDEGSKSLEFYGVEGD